MFYYPLTVEQASKKQKDDLSFLSEEMQEQVYSPKKENKTISSKVEGYLVPDLVSKGREIWIFLEKYSLLEILQKLTRVCTIREDIISHATGLHQNRYRFPYTGYIIFH